MEDKNNIIKSLKTIYYMHIVFCALIFLLVFFRVLLFASGEMEINYTIEVYAIMITLIAIPLSLRQFARKIRKLPQPAEKSVAERVYWSAFLWRLSPLSVVTLMNIMLFGLSRNVVVPEGHNIALFSINNFFWFSIVSLAILLIFCRPSEYELEKLSSSTSLTNRDSTPVADHATSLPENETDIMWWEKGKEKKVPIDSVITENAET